MTRQQAETLRRLLAIAETEARRQLPRNLADRLVEACQVVDRIETEG